MRTTKTFEFVAMNFDDFAGLLNEVGRVLTFLAGLPAEDQEIILRIDWSSRKEVLISRTTYQPISEFSEAPDTSDLVGTPSFICGCANPNGCSLHNYAMMLYYALTNHILAGSRFRIKPGVVENLEGQVILLPLGRT